MISSVTEIFSKQVYGRKLLSVFERIAYTLTCEYIQDAHDHIEQYGCPPSFEEKIRKVKALTNDLTMRASWIRDEYKDGKGYRSIRLTTGCKRVTKRSVNEYLRQVKYLDAINSSRNKAPLEQNYGLYLAGLAE